MYKHLPKYNSETAVECEKHTVEKEPSPSILPNLKSSGFFFRGCGVCTAGCARRSVTWLLADVPTARASEADPSMVGQWLLLAPGIASGEQESGWFLTIDGCEQEQMTTLGWIGTTSYWNPKRKDWENNCQCDAVIVLVQNKIIIKKLHWLPNKRERTK